MRSRTTRRAGRPRGFDAELALDRALEVFWRKGYEGASLSDLTRAMGINRPSLYGAFGDKEALFRKVLERYAEGPASFIRKALEAPTARAVAERLLEGSLKLQMDPSHPRGCLTVHGALACSNEAEPIRRELIAWRQGMESDIRERLARARAEGDLPRDADPAALARYLVTVLQGMAVQAAGGASRKQMQAVIRTVLQAWPG